jgi:hypothetical protein
MGGERDTALGRRHRPNERPLDRTRRGARYNSSFSKPMEAERINQIASSLADLQSRTVELRRYL